jgi:hypothetical protein
MWSAGLKARPEIREYLAQTCHIKLGQIKGAEALLGVIEAMAEPVQRPRCEFQRVGVIADSPQWALSGAFGHA